MIIPIKTTKMANIFLGVKVSPKKRYASIAVMRGDVEIAELNMAGDEVPFNVNPNVTAPITFVIIAAMPYESVDILGICDIFGAR